MVHRTVLGIGGAILGALIGAVAWAIITDVTNFQIGYMAIAVGWLAGYGMRTLGGAPNVMGARVAALVGFLGCVLGNLITAGIEIVKHDTSTSAGFVALAMLTRPQIDIGILRDTFNVMDVLFYGIAIYAAYRAALNGRRPMPVPAAAPAPPPGERF
jgi:hypothetical protein